MRRNYQLLAFIITLIIGLAPFSVQAVLKSKTSALVNFEYLTAVKDNQSDFRYARLGYVGRTDFATLNLELNLNRIDQTTPKSTISPILEQAHIEYRLKPYFTLTAGLQATNFGMSASRPDGTEFLINRGGFDLLQFDHATGINLDLRLSQSFNWQFAVYNNVERSILVNRQNLSTLSDSPLITTKIEYQYIKAFHAEFNAATQQYKDRSNSDTIGFDLGLWGYATPSVKLEFELIWYDNIQGIRNRSEGATNLSASYRYSRSWEALIRNQSIRDSQTDSIDELLVGFHYHLDRNNRLSAAWRSTQSNPRYDGSYASGSGLFLQFQFRH